RGPAQSGRVARGATDARLGHRAGGRGDPHHRHAHRPAARQAARPLGPHDARSDPDRARSRLHGGTGSASPGRHPEQRDDIMNRWLHGRAKALLTFTMIAALVIGGLGWVTAETLRLEEAQFQADAERELADRLGRALWQLDSRVAPALAREDGRP